MTQPDDAITADAGICAPLEPDYDPATSGRGLIARRMIAAGLATVDDIYTDTDGNPIGLRPEAYERLAELCNPACRTDDGHTFGQGCVIDMRQTDRIDEIAPPDMVIDAGLTNLALDRLRDDIRDHVVDAAVEVAEQFETDPFAITLAATEQAVERLQSLIDAWVETRKAGNRLVLEHRAQLAVLNTALRAMRKVAPAGDEPTDDV